METGESARRWQARPAGQEELDTLIAVFNTVYGKSQDRNLLEWKYFLNPHGPAVMWVAENEEARIVGSVAFMPRRMRIRGKEYLTYHGADAMVLPEWQRGGILITLLTQVYDQCFAQGAPLVHIFPNRRSVGALRKMGLHPVSLVQELELPLRGSYLFQRLIRKVPAAAPLAVPVGDAFLQRGMLKKYLARKMSSRIERIERFDEALAEAGTKALKAVPVHMVRDADFLNWRYIDTPSKCHRVYASYQGGGPAGYLVLECAAGRAYLADLIAPDEEIGADLLAFAVGEAARQGCEMLQSMALEGDGIHRLLAAGGFRALPKDRLVPLMIRIGPAGEPMRTVLIDPAAWYIHHGDRDVEHMTPSA